MLSVENPPLLPGLLRDITVHLIRYQPLKGPELRWYQDSPSHTFSLDYRAIDEFFNRLTVITKYSEDTKMHKYDMR